MLIHIPDPHPLSPGCQPSLEESLFPYYCLYFPPSFFYAPLSLTHAQGPGGRYRWQHSVCARRTLPALTRSASLPSCVPVESKGSWKFLLIPFFSLSVYHWPADGRPLRELSIQQVSAHAALALLWGGDQAQGLVRAGQWHTTDRGSGPKGHSLP